MRTILADIPGAINIADDILVYGKTQEEHDTALERTLEALAKKSEKVQI